ncbi:MAG: G/U mismatch-specific DNA glycosylase [Phycisphaeraceae bacterium]
MKRPAISRADLQAARDGQLRDVWPRGVKVVFCGINPSLYSAATGRHFARPGNRFWPTLHQAGFTDRQLSPFEDHLLPRYGCGLTNLVNRATARADELTRQELREGGQRLREKVAERRPRCLAVVGITAYRTAFDQPRARLGRQERTIEDAAVWVLPNPSGINAHYQLDDLARLFRELREHLYVQKD